ncbi:threonine/homoserine/homoserine lactone efflux protein [Motilibacter peucedani]|uniref:Threonine/homoserine/homoserine lactone efflux protein n=1 Tax=Motilibacter peucedani TaxID=598650 RepID=A0A420XMN9_9ACTN|nr:LysE family transporter [Motilibacter peucedani]RKS72551.1 threonine/homoserine/homoserine lactone efflux protein [Motilibacter peucedani]
MDALALGLSIGLAAGISPGPLLALVVTETLRSGWRAGAATACAPLLSDVLVVTGVLLVLQHLPEAALGAVGVVGGVFVVWSGVATVREARTAQLRTRAAAPAALVQALRRAAVVNLLSPHPWISWATALGPLTVSAWRDAPSHGVALVVGFYATLVGAKVAVAVLVGRSSGRMGEVGYRRALTGAGLLLVAAGVALVVEFGRTV